MAEINIFNFFSSSWWKDYQDPEVQSEVKKRISLARVLGNLLLIIVLFWTGIFEDWPPVFSFFIIALSLTYTFLYALHWKNIHKKQKKATRTARTISGLNIALSIVEFVIVVIYLIAFILYLFNK